MLFEASKDPALFMASLYMSAAELHGMRGTSEATLTMAIKVETLRQLNLRLRDNNNQYNFAIVAAIGFLASGVQVCMCYHSPPDFALKSCV
jgi:hypothetical protein